MAQVPLVRVDQDVLWIHVNSGALVQVSVFRRFDCDAGDRAVLQRLRFSHTDVVRSLNYGRLERFDLALLLVIVGLRFTF